MTQATLEVLLIGGKALKNTDLFGKSDPYAIVSCNAQDQKSKTVEGGGANPTWNQSFFFTVDQHTTEVTIKLFDEDHYTADDIIGTAKIPLDKVLVQLEVPANFYDVVRPSGHVQGKVEAGLKFTPKDKEQRPTQTHHKLQTHHNIMFKHQQQQQHMSEGPYGESSEGGWKS